MPDFFDSFFGACLVFVGLCAATDWWLSKDKRLRIREVVGDFWTWLQYNSLGEITFGVIQRIYMVGIGFFTNSKGKFSFLK
jgi:hypothetical protein